MYISNILKDRTKKNLSDKARSSCSFTFMKWKHFVENMF